MIGSVRNYAQLLRYLGPGWAWNRVSGVWQNRTGYLARKFPAGRWEDWSWGSFLADQSVTTAEAYARVREANTRPFFFKPGDRGRLAPLLKAYDSPGQSPLAEAERLREGKWRYFSKHEHKPGFPPDWFKDPFGGGRIAGERHWSRIDDFSGGDIKCVWEPSRFGWVYALVRAYWRTGQEEFAETFWQLLEHWRAANPPNLGPNWKCGQEASFRAMAWCFALHGFADAPASTPERISTLAGMLAFTAARVEGHIHYALSQRNNHGISEALGLWTIGTLFPEFKHARRWEQQGRELLEELGLSLIYEDGSFSQYSVNYHRVMLHDFLWVMRLADLQRKPFSPALRSRFEKAVEWLWNLQDEVTGGAPNSGANDGALILPLSNCDYTDFRPVVQSAWWLVKGERAFAPGPWDEELLWLGGPDALTAPRTTKTRQDFHANAGGYHVLRGHDGFAFFRCGDFRDRPSHADLLHVDLWWRGHNVARDAGSFGYNAPAPFNDTLSRTACHNTVSVDGRDQMHRFSRFIWLPWAKSKVTRQTQSDDRGLIYCEGEHEGYQQLPGVRAIHRRGVLRLGERGWVILDRITSPLVHDCRLHWLLDGARHDWNEGAGSLTLHLPSGDYTASVAGWGNDLAHELVQGEESEARGWQSRYYLDREPALSWMATTRAKSVCYISAFGAGVQSVSVQGDECVVAGREWHACLTSLRQGHDQKRSWQKVLFCESGKTTLISL